MQKCTSCDLCMRSTSLPPLGNKLADVMLILNHPDYYENKHEQALDSPRGKHIEYLLNEVGFVKESVYTTYGLHCYPTGGSTGYQRDTCSRLHLSKELKLVKPKIIIVFTKDTILELNKVLQSNLSVNSYFQTFNDYVIFLMPNPVKYARTGDNAYPVTKFEAFKRFYKTYINPYHFDKVVINK